LAVRETQKKRKRKTEIARYPRLKISTTAGKKKTGSLTGELAGETEAFHNRNERTKSFFSRKKYKRF